MAAGVTAPIVELSYMPAVIANCTGRVPFPPSDLQLGLPACDAKGKTTHYYKGIDVMPREWEFWHNLINRFGQHVVERYGEAAVAQWCSFSAFCSQIPLDLYIQMSFM